MRKQLTSRNLIAQTHSNCESKNKHPEERHVRLINTSSRTNLSTGSGFLPESTIHIEKHEG